jgi:uncharacterized damage-inducible protein DinB
MSTAELTHDFSDYACRKLEENLGQVIRCAELLSPEDVWHKPNRHCNSVGNLILHLSGNVRQWIVAGIGGEPFQRDRPAEFAEPGPLPTRQIVGDLQETVQRAMKIIGAVDEAALGTRRSTQGYDMTTQAAIFHVVEHFSFHTGQIIHATKLLRDLDLSLYDGQGRRIDGGPGPRA